MITLQFFFRSWYGKLWVMIFLAAISALLITFYTTSQSLAASLTMKKHLIVFSFSFILMLLAIIPIAYVVYRLDGNTYLQQDEFLRYLVQFALLVVLFAAIALRVVYNLYLFLFGIDLQKGEYFERDFVVVMFCMILVQGYYAMRKERKVSNYRKKRITILRKLLFQYEDKIKSEEIKNKELQKKHESELAELKGKKQRLRASHEHLSMNEIRLKACLKEAIDKIDVMIGAVNEVVRMSQIAYFYLKEGSAKSKLVDVRLLDGRDGTVDIDSLAKIEKLWPNLFFRAGRGLLIQHMAIKDQYKDGLDYIVELFGESNERLRISGEAYDRLLDIQREWIEILPNQQDQN